jgi:hypothetical protein
MKETIQPSKIWERILETGDLDELEFLLRLVLTDEESIQVILRKLADFTFPENTNIGIQVAIDPTNFMKNA